MENALTISQLIFYSISSLTIIVLFFFLVVGAYRVTKILKTLQAIARDIHDVSDEAKEKIEEIIEKLSLLPILSFFIKKAKGGSNPKRKVEKNK
jgi:hypothetical protein